MTEQTPEQPTPTMIPGAIPLTDVTDTPETKGSGRFAAYDTRLGRFTGGVHDTRKAAADAAKDRGVKASDVKVREV